MRNIRSSLIRQIGGREVIRELYEAVQLGWSASAAYYRAHELADGYGLTAVRRDHVEAALEATCLRRPATFPAFDARRKQSRSFALIEMEDLVFSAAIVPRRNVRLAETGYRRHAGRQIALWNQPAKPERPIVAVLLIVNGRPSPRFLRDRPREVVIRFLDGPGYRLEEIKLDAMFSKTFNVPRTLAKAKLPNPTTKISVTLVPEHIERLDTVRLKPGIGPSQTQVPSVKYTS